jgi:hypothetical protein
MYTGLKPPPPLENEGAMLTTAIRIDPFNKFDILHSASRVNYAKTYNIEHNVKVKPYGIVNASFMHHLVRQWTEVIIGRATTPIQSAFLDCNQANLWALGFTQNMVTAVAAMVNRRKGPNADPRIAIISVARDSARVELQTEQLNASENLANHVVDLIQAGMMYFQAVSHVRRLSTNGVGFVGENDAVGEDPGSEGEDEAADEDEDDAADDGDDDEGDEAEQEDVQEEEGGEASSSSSSEEESDTE